MGFFHVTMSEAESGLPVLLHSHLPHHPKKSVHLLISIATVQGVIASCLCAGCRTAQGEL